MKKGTHKTEYVVQTRPGAVSDYSDTTFVYTEKQKAVDYVRSARQLDSYEYRVLRRETIEFVEDI